VFAAGTNRRPVIFDGAKRERRAFARIKIGGCAEHPIALG
jgi:hypothetical protein